MRARGADPLPCTHDLTHDHHDGDEADDVDEGNDVDEIDGGDDVEGVVEGDDVDEGAENIRKSRRFRRKRGEGVGAG